GCAGGRLLCETGRALHHTVSPGGRRDKYRSAVAGPWPETLGQCGAASAECQAPARTACNNSAVIRGTLPSPSGWRSWGMVKITWEWSQANRRARWVVSQRSVWIYAYCGQDRG